MKDYTRFLREEREKDIYKIQHRNWNKYERQTPEQRTQAREDKHKHYFNKWSALLEKCETAAQRKHCTFVLSNLYRIK